MIIRFCLILLFLFIYRQPITTEHIYVHAPNDKLTNEQTMHWVDSVYQTLDLDQRIGQLMMIRAHSDKGETHKTFVLQQIEKYHVGGLCFFQGAPSKQIDLINEYQRVTNIPLLIAMDAEWGLGMRMKDSTMSFPKQMTLGAIKKDESLFEMGYIIGKQLSRVGVHMNFAPVVDVNNNPQNPVINVRSFGEDPEAVSRKAVAYMRGMRAAGVMSCAKHFPGHGDTDADSHYDLPVILHDRRRMHKIELYPFRSLIAHDVEAVMVAHLEVPALDSTKNRPTTLSPIVVTDLLKNQMQYHGLVITDAMEMKGVTKHFKVGVAEAEAIRAGNDILCLPRDVPAAVRAIKDYLRRGLITEEQIAHSVKKILANKHQFVVPRTMHISKDHVREDLHTTQATLINKGLYQHAITLVRDDYELIPMTSMAHNDKIVLMNRQSQGGFVNTLKQYGSPQVISIQDHTNLQTFIQSINKAQTIFAVFDDLSNKSSKGFGVDQTRLAWLKEANKRVPVVPVLFGSPYALKYFDSFGTVIVGYESNEWTGKLVAEAIMGASTFEGELPVSTSARSVQGSGISSKSLFRIAEALPEEVHMSSTRLKRVDSLLEAMVDLKVMPGAQLAVMKDRRLIYHHAVGYHTYDKKRPVATHHIYDLASLTKVLATTISVMHLYDQGYINVFDPIGKYLPELKGTNKEHLIIEDILIHKAGLKAWIPFYENTLNKMKKPDRRWYSSSSTETHPIQVADRLFINEAYQDTIWKHIVDSEVRPVPGYRYSDLGFLYDGSAYRASDRQDSGPICDGTLLPPHEIEPYNV